MLTSQSQFFTLSTHTQIPRAKIASNKNVNYSCFNRKITQASVNSRYVPKAQLNAVNSEFGIGNKHLKLNYVHNSNRYQTYMSMNAGLAIQRQNSDFDHIKDFSQQFISGVKNNLQQFSSKVNNMISDEFKIQNFNSIGQNNQNIYAMTSQNVKNTFFKLEPVRNFFIKTQENSIHSQNNKALKQTKDQKQQNKKDEFNRQKKIVVLGSLNLDVFLKMERMPLIGETLNAEDQIFKAFGGKGANQAISASRLNHKKQQKKDNKSFKVQMLGQIGSDQEGQSFIDYLKENGIDNSGIITQKDSNTGQAYILSMSKSGDNSIIIVGGANQNYDTNSDQLDEQWKYAIRTSDILMLQREIPERINILAAEYANQMGCRVILDMGGKDEPISERLLNLIDIISPNQTEFQRIVDSDKDLKEIGDLSSEENLNKCISKMMSKYPYLNILYKQGNLGASYYERDQDFMDKQMNERSNQHLFKHTYQKAYNFHDFKHKNINLVDTTGAGDSFTGAFAVALLEGKQTKEALDFACKAAFLTVSKLGASQSMPLREDLENLFEKEEETFIKKHEGIEDHCFFGVIRHAERADRALYEKNDRWAYRVDPPLSSEGNMQAIFAGQFLKEFFQKNQMKFDKIIIECSPFMRTMQTASSIAEALGVEEIEINYLSSEHLYTDFPDANPVPNLWSQNQTNLNHPDFIQFNKLSKKVKFIDKGFYKKEIYKRWPEKLSDSHERALLLQEHLSERMNEFKKNGEITKNKKICYLVISHGMMVEQMGNMLDQVNKEDSKFVMPNPINYKQVSSDQKKELFNSVKEMDWTADAIRYMCMNLFAVKYGKDEKFEDYRTLEVKSNNIIKEMERRKNTQEGLGNELIDIYNERQILWNNLKKQNDQDEEFIEEFVKEDDYDDQYYESDEENQIEKDDPAESHRKKTNKKKRLFRDQYQRKLKYQFQDEAFVDDYVKEDDYDEKYYENDDENEISQEYYKNMKNDENVEEFVKEDDYDDQYYKSDEENEQEYQDYISKINLRNELLQKQLDKMQVLEKSLDEFQDHIIQEQQKEKLLDQKYFERYRKLSEYQNLKDKAALRQKNKASLQQERETQKKMRTQSLHYAREKKENLKDKGYVEEFAKKENYEEKFYDDDDENELSVFQKAR